MTKNKYYISLINLVINYNSFIFMIKSMKIYFMSTQKIIILYSPLFQTSDFV